MVAFYGIDRNHFHGESRSCRFPAHTFNVATTNTNTVLFSATMFLFLAHRMMFFQKKILDEDVEVVVLGHKQKLLPPTLLQLA